MSMFVEKDNDLFYSVYAKYNASVLDYCIIESNVPHLGEGSHKNAVVFAMGKFSKKLNDEYDLVSSCNANKLHSSIISVDEFFSVKTSNSQSYCNLFLNPPYGSNYTIKDFNKINAILFPDGKHHLEIRKWNDDWSNYFDDGREWWGTMCVSIYDSKMKRYVVICASATD